MGTYWISTQEFDNKNIKNRSMKYNITSWSKSDYKGLFQMLFYIAITAGFTFCGMHKYC